MTRLRSALAQTVCVLMLASTAVLWYLSRERPIETARPRPTGLLVNSSVCQLPEFHPWDPTVLEVLREERPLTPCSGDSPVRLTQLGRTLTMDVHRDRLRAGCRLDCCLRSVRREQDGHSDDQFRLGEQEVCFRGRTALSVSEQFVKVTCACSDEPDVAIFEDFRAFFIPEVDRLRSQQRVSVSDVQQLSVYLVGIDSVSTLNFRRFLPKVREVLETDLQAVPMLGLTKVGANTLPNLVALLTGLRLDQLNQSLREEPYDHQPLIWKHFSSLNYLTMYTEDMSNMATFNFHRRGFLTQPTDIYLRPLHLASEQSRLAQRRGDHCVGHRLTFELQLQLLQDLMAAPDPSSPHFALVFSNAPSHAGPLSHIGALQPGLLQFLRAYRTSSRRNSSVLILFSDHGMRFGPVMRTELGGYESRMPLLYVILPPWYERQYPRRVASLRVNSRRLTTFFDVHATLRHLLADAGASLPNVPSPGLSLFAPVPEPRSCRDAGVDPAWCTCRRHVALPADHAVVVRAAVAAVRHIDTVLLRAARDRCARLGLLRVMSALLTVSEGGGPVQDTEYSLRGFDELTVQLMTAPGGAEFEATVRCYSGPGDRERGTAGGQALAVRCRPEHRLEVLEVTRLNLYRGQSDCLTHHHDERRYCYCTDLL
ncbi:hypothetical protein FJT64_012562 [Amphibalanus amphitrite]|uniref:Uncharacterized protein n=1 Tax=Amphibalanus amphitrite TaxID=1232801 RepID=A0A6A4VC59_AMPAM|nr:hypothetical protein FJT64_012562 [Amphibalanus amphitrite]